MPVKRPRLSQEWPRRVCRNSERESWGFLGPIAFRALSVALGPPLQRSRGVSGVIMPHLAIYTALSLAFVGALPAEAQTRTLRRNGEVLILNVRPRDAGNVVPVGSMNYPASSYGQTVSPPAKVATLDPAKTAD